MGLFLQTAILPGVSESAAKTAVEQASRQPGYQLIPDQCQYASCAQGTQILFGDQSSGLEVLAQELSKALLGPVLLLFIYDGDHWGYNFYADGWELDRFDTIPDYYCPITDCQRQRQAGSPEVLARYFPVLPGDVRDYLVFWTQEDLNGAEHLAYPGDRFPRGDCWQMSDFLARLGWPWPFDEDSQESPLPTLAAILAQNLPPRADPIGLQASYDFQLDDTFAPSSRVFTTSTLPSALDPGYIRRLLQEDGRFQPLGNMTPQEIIAERNKAQAAIKYPSLYHMDPKLATVSAFCMYWLGSADGAFWDLYEALYNDPNNVYLHRARGLRVALGVKRHIAVKDMTALLELDPQNRDVYLLCRAFFCRINRKTAQSNADLDELARIGFPAVRDTRINYIGFPKSFLAIVDEKRRQGRSGT